MENIMRTIARLKNDEIYIIHHYTENIFNRLFDEISFLKVIDKNFNTSEKRKEGNVTIIAEKDLKISKDISEELFLNYGTGVNFYDYKKKYAISANYCSSIFDFDLKNVFIKLDDIKKHDEDRVLERLSQLRNNKSYLDYNFNFRDGLSELAEFTLFFNMLYFNNAEKVFFYGDTLIEMLNEYKNRKDFEVVLTCKPADWICHDQATFENITHYFKQNKIKISV